MLSYLSLKCSPKAYRPSLNRENIFDIKPTLAFLKFLIPRPLISRTNSSIKTRSLFDKFKIPVLKVVIFKLEMCTQNLSSEFKINKTFLTLKQLWHSLNFLYQGLHQFQQVQQCSNPKCGSHYDWESLPPLPRARAPRG